MKYANSNNKKKKDRNIPRELVVMAVKVAVGFKSILGCESPSIDKIGFYWIGKIKVEICQLKCTFDSVMKAFH